jgi:exopolysaccharide biosynthesis predicted pyruvyltransferase EpsI/drug/metabolite transporter (DMT)-like permease
MENKTFKFDLATSGLKALGILVTWYLCATLAAWHLSGVLQKSESASFEVSCVLMMAGSLITFSNLLVDPKFHRKTITALRQRSTQQAAMWHYMGTLSMCMAQAAFSASLAQIVKSTEPVITILLSWLIHRTNINSRRLFGIIFTSLGVAVCCTGDLSLNSSGVIYALISACCFPLRNITSYKCEDGLSSTQRFGMVSTFGCIPAIGICIAKCFVLENSEWLRLPLDRMTVASIAHLGYNVASYAFLEASSPIFHSVANIIKRLVVTMSMYAMAQRNPSEIEMIGLLILACGIMLSSEIKIMSRSLVIFCMLCIMTTICFMLVTGEQFTFPHTQAPITKNSIVGSQAESLTTISGYSPSRLLACIKDIRRRHVEQLKDIFRQPQFQAGPLLLVDPAQHWNIGDSLLVQGEKDFANAFGWGERSVHTCRVAQVIQDPACPGLLRKSRAGTYKLAMWHAGGNWGDVWASIQGPRIQSFKYLLESGLTVVSMPQSLHYNNATIADLETGMIAAAAASYSDDWQRSRKRLVFLWRQANSYESAVKLYPFADNRLVPDIAFWCGPYLHHGAPSLQGSKKVDILLFLRIDKESTQSGAELHKKPETIQRMLKESKFASDRNLSFRMVDWHSVQHLRAVNPAEYKPKIETAVRLLDSGRVVIADRLHATILALLSMKPVFYVDQSYGKIKNTLDAAFIGSEACSDESSLRVFQTGSLAEALNHAARFLDMCKANGDCE